MLTYGILMLASLTVVGVLFITYGIWLHHLSGFTFYMTSGILTGLALFGPATLSLVFPNWSDFIYFGVLIIIFPILSLWDEAQERHIRKTRPSEWLAWENALAQQHTWAKWLLYPVQLRINQLAKESGHL